MNIKRQIRNHLIRQLPPELVDVLIENYLELKEKYYLRDYRETALYGGRFAECMLRVLQHIILGHFTPLGAPLRDFHGIVVALGQSPIGSHHDSLRLYIPKSLDVLYDIRNNRDVGHVGGDIEENFADSNLSLAISSWVLAEFIRVHYVGDINEAQRLVDQLIRIRVPTIQDFEGYLRILNPGMPLRSKIMALAFYRGDMRITIQELYQYLEHNHRHSDISRSVRSLIRNALLHKDPEVDVYIITEAGVSWTENNIDFSI